MEGVRACSGTLPAPPNPRFQLLERAPQFTQRSKNVLEGRWLLPSLQPSWEVVGLLGASLGRLEAARYGLDIEGSRPCTDSMESERSVMFRASVPIRWLGLGGGTSVVILANSSFSHRWSWADAAPGFCTAIGQNFEKPASRSKTVRDKFICEVCEV